MIFSKKTKPPQLSEYLASQMLENVFEACQRTPNTIPLKTLISYSNYRKERFSFQKILLVLILVLFCLLPLLFLYPEVRILGNETDTPYFPSYTISVDAPLPVQSVYAVLDGKAVLVSATGKNQYTVELKANGTLTVTAILINRQYQTRTVSVTGADVQAPTCSSSRLSEGVVYLTLSDEGSGVDYANVTAWKPDGTKLLPLSVDEAEGLVTFPCSQGSLEVYVPDLAGNTLHLQVTAR